MPWEAAAVVLVLNVWTCLFQGEAGDLVLLLEWYGSCSSDSPEDPSQVPTPTPIQTDFNLKSQAAAGKVCILISSRKNCKVDIFAYSLCTELGGMDFCGKCLSAVWKNFFYFYLMLSCVSHECWALLVIRTRWFEGLVSWVSVADVGVLDVWTNSLQKKAGNLVLLPELGENAGKVPTGSSGLQNDFSHYLVIGWSEARPSGSSCPQYANSFQENNRRWAFCLFPLCQDWQHSCKKCLHTHLNPACLFASVLWNSWMLSPIG